MAWVKLDIPPRSRRCRMGSEEFSEGTEYISVLDEGNADALLRRDYCISCWKKARLDQDTPRPGQIHWRSAVPRKSQGPRGNLRREEIALERLREILDRNAPEDSAEAFVLALLLTRSKKLHFKQELVREDGGIYLLYELAGTEEIWAVPKVHVSAIETAKLQHALSEKFKRQPQ